LADQGYKIAKANPDEWIRAQVRPNGFLYYGVVVDDIIVVSQDPKYTMDAIAEPYRLEEVVSENLRLALEQT